MAKRKIIWSHRANIRLFEILDFYANKNKSSAYSAKLYRRITKELTLLDKHPELGIKTDFSTIRGLIIENFVLFYEITDTNIHVHTIWDSRQNPTI